MIFVLYGCGLIPVVVDFEFFFFENVCIWALSYLNSVSFWNQCFKLKIFSVHFDLFAWKILLGIVLFTLPKGYGIHVTKTMSEIAETVLPNFNYLNS